MSNTYDICLPGLQVSNLSDISTPGTENPTSCFQFLSLPSYLAQWQYLTSKNITDVLEWDDESETSLEISIISIYRNCWKSYFSHLIFQIDLHLPQQHIPPCLENLLSIFLYLIATNAILFNCHWFSALEYIVSLINLHPMPHFCLWCLRMWAEP